jgi:hypothetical protein
MTLDDGKPSPLINFIVFFLPLLSDFLNPIVTIWGLAEYREYFLYSICKRKRKHPTTKVSHKNESRIKADAMTITHN